MSLDQEALFAKVRRSRTFGNLRALFLLEEKKVLDVGCSEGHYLQCFGPQSLGLTIIEDHVRAASSRDLRVMRANVEDSHFSLQETFDVVWANNIFEHFNAPHLFLMRMKDVLAPGGILILGVPVVPTFSWLTVLRKFRGAYASSHVNFFTRHTLIQTVRAAGWNISAARLFYFRNPFVDALLNPIAPHIYVIATPNQHFAYAEKRLRSLEGYE